MVRELKRGKVRESVCEVSVLRADNFAHGLPWTSPKGARAEVSEVTPVGDVQPVQQCADTSGVRDLVVNMGQTQKIQSPKRIFITNKIAETLIHRKCANGPVASLVTMPYVADIPEDVHQITDSVAIQCLRHEVGSIVVPPRSC